MTIILDDLSARSDDVEETVLSRPHDPRYLLLLSIGIAGLFMAISPAALARSLVVAVNAGASRSNGITTTAKDFGASGSYGFTRYFGLRAGYESITSFEMTIFSLAGVGRYPLTPSVHLIGMAGIVHWSESPSGKPGAHGINPLWAVGLSYTFDPRWSTRIQYQQIRGGSGPGEILNTVLLSLRYRL